MDMSFCFGYRSAPHSSIQYNYIATIYICTKVSLNKGKFSDLYSHRPALFKRCQKTTEKIKNEKIESNDVWSITFLAVV